MSDWICTFTVFQMEWLTDIYAASADEFPREQVNMLLTNAPRRMVTYFQEYAANHPELSRWKLRMKMENGRVEYVEAIQ